MAKVRPRQRAPQREGLRTTLRVPEELSRAAEQLGKQLGTTKNDALVRLAEEGLAVNERRRRVEQLAQQRQAAVGQVGFEDVFDFPSEAELEEAMLSGRRGS